MDIEKEILNCVTEKDLTKLYCKYILEFYKQLEHHQLLYILDKSGSTQLLSKGDYNVIT